MRLAIFSMALFSSAFLTASFAAAQPPYVGGVEHEVVMDEGYSPTGLAPAGYYGYRGPMNWGAPNSNWGYSGGCCSNVWDGYCEEQSCHQLGCHKGSLWCKLKCFRVKIFGSKSCCCGQSCCQSHCGQGCCNGCGVSHAGEEMAPAAEYDAGEPEAMPLPPQTRSSHASPLSKASRSQRNDHAGVRQSWSMPRMSSAQKSSRR